MSGTYRWVAPAAAALVAVSLAGCPFQKTITAVRPEGHYLTWAGENMASLGGDGEAFGIEVAPGDDTQPAMGPLFIGGAYSVGRLYDDGAWSYEHRAGVRARSSMLDHASRSYPFAMVGVYLGWIDPAGGTGKFGMGVEGGYGVRLGFGGHLAVDFEMIFAYGRYEAAFDQLSTRLGGGLSFNF